MKKYLIIIFILLGVVFLFGNDLGNNINIDLIEYDDKTIQLEYNFNLNQIKDKYNIGEISNIYYVDEKKDNFWGEFYIIYIPVDDIHFRFDHIIYNKKTLKCMPLYNKYSKLFLPERFNKNDYNDFVIPLHIKLKTKLEFLDYLKKIEFLFRSKMIFKKEMVISAFKKEYDYYSTFNDEIHSFYNEQLDRLSGIDYSIYFYKIDTDKVKVTYFSYFKLEVHLINKIDIIIKSNGEIIEINRTMQYHSEIYPDNTNAFALLWE